jgi:MFS transporter, DHA2 family, multidrug resistance protein
MTAAVAAGGGPDGHRTVTVAALMATYMQAANITLPNAAVLHIQGTLSMANDELGWVFTSYIAASVITMPMTRWLGPLRPEAGLSAFDRRLRPRPGARHACGDPDPVRLRPDRPRSCERHACAAIDGDLLDVLPPKRHARISLVWTVCLMLGIVSGSSIGGWLSEYHGWRSIFYVSLPMSGFIFLAVGLSLPEKRAEQNPPLDFFGLATFSLGMIG